MTSRRISRILASVLFVASVASLPICARPLATEGRSAGTDVSFVVWFPLPIGPVSIRVPLPGGTVGQGSGQSNGITPIRG